MFKTRRWSLKSSKVLCEKTKCCRMQWHNVLLIISIRPNRAVIDSLIDPYLKILSCTVDRHQQTEARIASLQSEIKQMDEKIAAFAGRLRHLEQDLHDAVSDETLLKNVDGIANKRMCASCSDLSVTHVAAQSELLTRTAESFSIQEVLSLAQKIGRTSVAPLVYSESTGLTTSRPPAPMQDELERSRLHLSVDGKPAIR